MNKISNEQSSVSIKAGGVANRLRQVGTGILTIAVLGAAVCGAYELSQEEDDKPGSYASNTSVDVDPAASQIVALANGIQDAARRHSPDDITITEIDGTEVKVVRYEAPEGKNRVHMDIYRQVGDRSEGGVARISLYTSCVRGGTAITDCDPGRSYTLANLSGPGALIPESYTQAPHPDEDWAVFANTVYTQAQPDVLHRVKTLAHQALAAS